MALTENDFAPTYEEIVDYVDDLLPMEWVRRLDGEPAWRSEWRLSLAPRPRYSWAEEVVIRVDDQTLVLDFGDGTEMRVQNPTRDIASEVLDMFVKLANVRKAERAAEAGA